MNIVLFGPPGAGKGTQGDNLVKNFNLFKLSTGDVLRKEIEEKTSLGNKIKDTIDKGGLISDENINYLMEKVLSNKQINNRLIFDGYPRNINQAKVLNLLLNKNNLKISCVLSLDVDKETVIKRVLGRRLCSNCGLIFNDFFNPADNKNHTCDSSYLNKRSDDNEKIIRSRFETYLEKTLPILSYYKEQNLLYQINGLAKIDVIFKEIQGIIASIET